MIKSISLFLNGLILSTKIQSFFCLEQEIRKNNKGVA